MADEYDALIRQANTTPTPVNEYDGLVAEDAQNAQTSLRVSMKAAAAADPEREAKVIDFADRLKLPRGTVERNLDTLQQQDVVERNDYDRLIKETPHLASWLQDPSNATIAKDDVDNLSMVEKVLDAAKRGYLTLKQTPYAGGIMVNRRLSSVSESNIAHIESRLAAGETPSMIPDSEDLYGIRFMSADERDQFKQQLRGAFESGTGEQITRLAQYEKQKRALPTDPDIAAAMNAHTFGEFWQHFMKKPTEFILTVGAESIPASAPGMLAAIPAGIAAGPVGVAGAIGANSFATDYASSVMEALQNEGVDLTDEKAVRAAVQDKEIMGRVGQQAFAHATIVGSVDALSGGLAGKTLIPKRMVMHPLAREAANVAIQAPVQGLAGAVGEAGGELAAGQDLQPGNIGAEFFGEFAGTPTEVASASAHRVIDAVQAARQAKQNARVFEALGSGVENSKTFRASADEAAGARRAGHQGRPGRKRLHPGRGVDHVLAVAKSGSRRDRWRTYRRYEGISRSAEHGWRYPHSDVALRDQARADRAQQVFREQPSACARSNDGGRGRRVREGSQRRGGRGQRRRRRRSPGARGHPRAVDRQRLRALDRRSVRGFVRVRVRDAWSARRRGSARSLQTLQLER
jgi:hypothetical protein